MRSIRRMYRQWRFMQSIRLEPDGIWVKKGRSPRDFSCAARLLQKERSSAEEYLRAHSDKYPWGRLWLEHGSSFPAPSWDLCKALIENWEFMPNGRCYFNALILSYIWAQMPELTGSSVQYVEGLSVEPTGVYPHAWITVDGSVFDPTWPGACIGTFFGVGFDPLWAKETAQLVDRVGMIEDWKRFEPYVLSKLGELP